jgi:hypothetical protein
MPWIADLIDGPLARRDVDITDDASSEPPAFLSIEGHEYLFDGWNEYRPRYRYRAPGEPVRVGRSRVQAET